MNSKQPLYHVTNDLLGVHRRVVSFAAVLCDATDFWGRALRDNTKIGCVGEYQKESNRG